MRKRLLIVAAVVVVVLLVGAGALYAYDSGHRDRIAHGITVGGVDIGGLTASQARARLERVYVPRFNRPVVTQFHGRRWVLTPRSARIAVDVDGTVADALRRSRGGTIFGRVWRSVTGGHVKADIAPKVNFSTAAVARLVSKVKHALNQPARDAHVSFQPDSLGLVPAQPGIVVRARVLTRAIERAVTDPAAPHRLAVPTHQIAPRVPTMRLAKQYPTVITVDRGHFVLKLWKNLHLVRSYPIAVGMQGLETPAGLYHILNKAVDPAWVVPKSPWAGSLAGQVIPPGPGDPIKARWMGIFNGAGIHGTDETSSIGHAFSHGCVRMLIPDVIDLYDRVSVGTPVYIGD